MEIARIPYVDGLSLEIRRIARMAGVRCFFFVPKTLRSLYQAKDSLLRETTTNAVYSVTCKTYSAEHIGETNVLFGYVRKSTEMPSVQDNAQNRQWQSMSTPPWYRMKSIGATCRSFTEQEEKWSARFGRLSTSTNGNQ